MRRMYILITVGLLLGCQGTGPAKIDNPVVGPPPPRLPPEKIRENQLAQGLPTTDDRPAGDDVAGKVRIKVDDGEQPRQYAAKSIDDVPVMSTSIRRVSLETTKDQDLPSFDDSMVVAMVNDQPVFAGEVLGPFRPQLHAAEEKLKQQYGKEYKPEMLHRLRAMFIQAHLSRIVDNKVLIQAAKATFKKNQYEGLCKSVDEEWTQQVQSMMEKSGVNSVQELDAMLKEQHYDMRENAARFKDEKIAMNYVMFKAHSKFEPTRKEMLAYYQEHHADYEYPARVRWQQLEITNEDNNGPEGAKKKIQVVVQELLNGADFTATVKKHGNGPKAAKGGNWDWTVKDSLANKDVDRELFTLPIGEMSGVIKTPNGYQIVQVLDRQDAGCKQFDTLQKDIESKMKHAEMSTKADKIVAEHRASALIKTVFDEDPSADTSPTRTADRGEDPDA